MSAHKRGGLGQSTEHGYTTIIYKCQLKMIHSIKTFKVTKFCKTTLVVKKYHPVLEINEALSVFSFLQRHISSEGHTLYQQENQTHLHNHTIYAKKNLKKIQIFKKGEKVKPHLLIACPNQCQCSYYRSFKYVSFHHFCSILQVWIGIKCWYWGLRLAVSDYCTISLLQNARQKRRNEGCRTSQWNDKQVGC